MMNMRTLLLVAGLATSLQAANLDTPAVGDDLNGWQKGGVAWYGTDELSFRASRPVATPTADGGLEIRMRVEEIRSRVPVYVADIRLLASGNGVIYSASVSGEVAGVKFKTAEVSRPEPVTSSGDEEAIEAPLSPDEQMRQDLASLLGSAIARLTTEDHGLHGQHHNKQPVDRPTPAR